MNISLVIERGREIGKVNPISGLIASIMIYSMIIPLLLVDLWASLYQFVYFWIMDIPFVKKSDYIQMDRYKLDKLNVWQKINCLYCEYANGMTAWLKAVANQTEIYSCAIKHSVVKNGQEHHENFYDYEEFLKENN